MDVHAERYEEEVVSQEPLKVVPSQENNNYRLARRVTYYALDVILVFLAFRFLLKAFGANPDSLFAQFVYAVSGPFALPFEGIFSNTSAPGAAVLEWSTLVAMLVYLLLAIGIVRLFKLIIKGGRPAPDDTVAR